ncbi:unnamed protein product (macronuclear) [Paramecium tetraurelia]|uniref:Uncharacterized protein n=1 Tax=Paramecium tetraurelia TaxID=5888 RepID=A0EGD0_PARTE|nr:uncharacterized protein GSPATT00026695001 [Paramecium tetraurelia]CAK94371.1 unnamed protein product [Paramecium tetraurelia]|eukprot:XP_001461744.1 hypothetical protein (macronuclear) [Paramecium tetraurelia strain d4-2]
MHILCMKKENNIMNKRVYVNYEQRWMQRPKIGNVDIVNQFQEINSISGNQYKSLSSNNTHFGTLSMENEVIIYEWHNQILQQIGSSVQIDTSFICFNIHLSPFFDILVDCYQDDEFKLLIVQDQQYNTVYTSQSSIPIKTKLKSMINDNNDTYIIYAQYYQDYCMLSLFSKQYSNLSQWNNNFIDFDIPIQIKSLHLYTHLTTDPIMYYFFKLNFLTSIQFHITQHLQFSYYQSLLHHFDLFLM